MVGVADPPTKLIVVAGSTVIVPVVDSVKQPPVVVIV